MSVIRHEKPKGDLTALVVEASYFRDTANASLTGNGGASGILGTAETNASTWSGTAHDSFVTTVDTLKASATTLAQRFGDLQAAISTYESDLSAAVGEWNAANNDRDGAEGLIAQLQPLFNKIPDWEPISRSDGDLYDESSNIYHWVRRDKTDSALTDQMHSLSQQIDAKLVEMKAKYQSAYDKADAAKRQAMSSFKAINADDVEKQIGGLTAVSTPGVFNPTTPADYTAAALAEQQGPVGGAGQPTTVTVLAGQGLWQVAAGDPRRWHQLIKAYPQYYDGSATLQTGQVLTIPPDYPAPPPTGANTHKVRSGDTLSAIAHQHGVTQQQLESANPRLSQGSKFLLDGEVVAIPVAAAVTTTTTPTAATVTPLPAPPPAATPRPTTQGVAKANAVNRYTGTVSSAINKIHKGEPLTDVEKDAINTAILANDHPVLGDPTVTGWARDHGLATQPLVTPASDGGGGGGGGGSSPPTGTTTTTTTTVPHHSGGGSW